MRPWCALVVAAGFLACDREVDRSASRAPHATERAAAPASDATAPPDLAFDFRIPRLDPAVIGTTQPCDLVRSEPEGPGRFFALCWNGHEGIRVDLTHTSGLATVAAGMRPRQRLRVEITAAGSGSGGPEATVALVERVADLPPAARPAAVPPPAEADGFDFNRVNREPALHETRQRCVVRNTNSVERIDRSEPALEGAAAWLPADAGFYTRVTCAHAGGFARVLIGAPGYRDLLRLRGDSLVILRVLHEGRYPAREAMTMLDEITRTPPARGL